MILLTTAVRAILTKVSETRLDMKPISKISVTNT